MKYDFTLYFQEDLVADGAMKVEDSVQNPEEYVNDPEILEKVVLNFIGISRYEGSVLELSLMKKILKNSKKSQINEHFRIRLKKV